MGETKKYNTIVIDPPWKISMAGNTKIRPKRAQELPYETMTIEKIKKFPIKDFANIGCHVYLWTTNKFLPVAFEILKSWDVNYHMMITWVKPSGIPASQGYKFATEFCLLGFYKSPMQKFTRMGLLNWVKGFNKSGNHSCKPEEFYNIVKETSPEPRVDIFSRRLIAGFDSWGNEAPDGKQEELKNFLK